MRERLTAAAVSVLVVLGVGLSASEPPPDALVKTMKDLGTAVGDVRTGVGAKDYAGLTKAATTLQALLKTNGAFWQQRKNDDALSLNQVAVKAAADLLAAAKGKNDDGILAAQKALTGSCGSCHMAHRERTPDGKYAIK